MRLLVTGADGFVGSHVVGQALRRGWEVDGVEQQSGSVYPSRFPDEPVDVVVSLAAEADPKEALRDPRWAYHNGVAVMLDTLDYAGRVGARVLHVSTNEVYGSAWPFYGPRGPYAGAKACQEIVCRAQDDVPVTIVVTQSLFGERQQPNKLVPSVVRSLLAGTPVALQGDGGRWAERPFLYVGDLVRMLLECAEDQCNEEGWDGRGRFHIGATDWLSVKHVVDALSDGLGVEARVEQVPSGDRAGHELKVEPIGWEWDGEPTDALGLLPGLARWYRDHPEWL